MLKKIVIFINIYNNSGEIEIVFYLLL